MTEPAPIQLRAAGVGVVVAGILLVLVSALTSAALGAIVTTVVGLLYISWGHDALDPRRVGLGMVLVGGIGMIESSRFGFGFEPLVIGTFAMAFGMFDILLGLIFGRLRDQRQGGS